MNLQLIGTGLLLVTTIVLIILVSVTMADLNKIKTGKFDELTVNNLKIGSDGKNGLTTSANQNQLQIYGTNASGKKEINTIMKTDNIGTIYVRSLPQELRATLQGCTVGSNC